MAAAGQHRIARGTHNPLFPTVAVVGAGHAGVVVATHCVRHGFNVVLFERETRNHHAASHPVAASLIRDCLPLSDGTRFEAEVGSIWRDHDGKWIVGHPSHGRFGGIIVATGNGTGSRGAPLPGRHLYAGLITNPLHLPNDTLSQKNVMITSDSQHLKAVTHAVCSGASGVYVIGIQRGFTGSLWRALFLLRLASNALIIALSQTLGLRRGIRAQPHALGKILWFIWLGRLHLLSGSAVGFAKLHVLVAAAEHPDHTPPRSVRVDIYGASDTGNPPQLGFLPNDIFTLPHGQLDQRAWYLWAFPQNASDICVINNLSVHGQPPSQAIMRLYTRYFMMHVLDASTKPSEWQIGVLTTSGIQAKLTSLLPGAILPAVQAILPYAGLVMDLSRWKWSIFVLFGTGAGMLKDFAVAEHVGAEAITELEGVADSMSVLKVYIQSFVTFLGISTISVLIYLSAASRTSSLVGNWKKLLM